MRDSAPNSLKKDMLNLAESASVGMELIETGTSEPKTNMKGDVNLSNVPITQKRIAYQGGVQTNHIASRHKMKRKSTKTCRLCNKDGHNVGGPKCKKGRSTDLLYQKMKLGN